MPDAEVAATGIDDAAGDRARFVNLTGEFLPGEPTLPFGPERVLREVLETVCVDEAVLRGVAALVDRGSSPHTMPLTATTTAISPPWRRRLELPSALNAPDPDLDRFPSLVAPDPAAEPVTEVVTYPTISQTGLPT